MQIPGISYLATMGQILRNQIPNTEDLCTMIKYGGPPVVAATLCGELQRLVLRHPETTAWMVSQICFGGKVLCIALAALVAVRAMTPGFFAFFWEHSFRVIPETKFQELETLKAENERLRALIQRNCQVNTSYQQEVF